jgi:hypothetical protein
MALEDVGIVFAEHKESSTEWLDVAPVGKEPMASTEATSKQDTRSDRSDASDDTATVGMFQIMVVV